MSIIEVFWCFENRQKYIYDVFFLLACQFPRFLILTTLSNWARLLKLSVWVGATVLYRTFFFEFLESGPSSSTLRLTPPKVESVTPIFNHFLMELECCNFYCAMGSIFCIGIFQIFKIEVPFPLPPSPLHFLKVKFYIYCAILMKFETLISYVYQ